MAAEEPRGAGRVDVGLAGPDELDAVAALVAASFPDNPKGRPEVARWQYDNPFGPCTVAVARDGDGRIVSAWAAAPLPAVVDGVRATIARTGDAATLPSHRGRGLFNRLAPALYAACARHGMPVALSAPNDQSVGSLERVGWRPVGEVRAHVLPLDAGYVAERLPAPRALVEAGRRLLFHPRRTADVAEPVDDLPGDVDGLWARVAVDLSHGVWRDRAYLTWRYLDRPGKDYLVVACRRGGRLDGLAVAGVRSIGTGRFADLLELQAVDAMAARALVNALREHLAGEVDGLTAGALVGSRLAEQLLDAGLRLLPRRLQDGPLRIGVADTTGARPDVHEAPWTVQWGDMDHL